MRDSENKMVAEKTTNQHIKINRAEVKGNSIVYFCQNADDNEEAIKTESPDAVIHELDSGVYDDDLPSGMRLVAALWTGAARSALSCPLSRASFSGAGWSQPYSLARWKTFTDW